MELKDLVGFQLVSITNEAVVIQKDDEQYRLDILDDGGDCCGYNDIETRLLITESNLKRNPVITDVNVFRYDGDWDGQACTLTFFGESKPLAMINTLSNSGSGWCYGAAVSLVCKSIDLNETLSQW